VIPERYDDETKGRPDCETNSMYRIAKGGKQLKRSPKTRWKRRKTNEIKLGPDPKEYDRKDKKDSERSTFGRMFHGMHDNILLATGLPKHLP